MVLSGLITGIVISAFAFTLIMMPKYPAQDKRKIKGTMPGTTDAPVVGDFGTIQGVGTQCNANFSDVVFDNYPDHTVFRCHSDPASPGEQVQVVFVNGGQFCSGGAFFCP